jgi:hypothetical protein
VEKSTGIRRPLFALLNLSRRLVPRRSKAWALDAYDYADQLILDEAAQARLAIDRP